MPSRAQTLQKEMRSLHTLIRSTRTFIYLPNRVLFENKFSNLNELQIAKLALKKQSLTHSLRNYRLFMF